MKEIDTNECNIFIFREESAADLIDIGILLAHERLSVFRGLTLHLHRCFKETSDHRIAIKRNQVFETQIA
jgi:hypothetical protein